MNRPMNMRPLQVLVVLLAGCGAGSEPLVRDPVPFKLRLLSADGLRPIDRKSREFASIATALNASRSTTKPGAWTGAPSLWDVWKVESTDGQAYHLAVEGCPLTVIPGSSSAGLHLLRNDGTPAAGCVFTAGWRLDLHEAVVVNATWLETIAVELRIQAAINGSDVKRQYYALAGDRFALVRLEDSEGRAHMNHYGAPNWTIGPLPPLRTEEQWERVILSDEPVPLLEALVWLGGIHLDSALPPPPTLHEDRASALLCEAVRARPAVGRRVRDLRASLNHWIREAAVLAEDPASYNPERRR